MQELYVVKHDNLVITGTLICERTNLGNWEEKQWVIYHLTWICSKL